MQKTPSPSPSRVALAAAIKGVQEHEATKHGLEQQRQRLEAAVYEAIGDVDVAREALRDFEKTLTAYYVAEAQGTALEKPFSRRQLEDAVEEAELRLQARRDAQSACASAIRENPWRGDLARRKLDQAISAVVANDGREAVRAVAQHVAAIQRDLAGWGRALAYLQEKEAFERNPEIGGSHGQPLDEEVRWTLLRLSAPPRDWDNVGGSDYRASWQGQTLDASVPWRAAVAALATNPDAPLPDGPARTVALVGKSPRLVGSPE